MPIESLLLLSILNDKYLGQKIFIVEIKNYVYAIPFIQKKENWFFLKTIFPSRKLTKKYLLKNKK